MALKGFLALVDDKLSEAYHFVAPDKTKHRKPFVAALDKALAGFNEGKQARGKSAMWSANNNTVRFTPNLGGSPVAIHEGKKEFFIPAERFPSAIAELRKEVEAGALDDELHEAAEAKSGNDPLGGLKPSGQRLADKPQRAGWSDERRAKFEATQAAKQAAKSK